MLLNHLVPKNFDYFKYNGKTNASVKSFDKRKDKFKFIKLSTKLSDDQIIEYFDSGLLFIIKL